jgi:hypothetical protein
MSAPLERITATSGRPFVRAITAAASICDDDTDDSAPCFSEASTSTQTTAPAVDLAHVGVDDPGHTGADGERHGGHHTGPPRGGAVSVR